MLDGMDIDGTDGKPYVLIESGNIPVTRENRFSSYNSYKNDVQAMPPNFIAPKTGIVYDNRMRYHGNIHEEEHHPEDPSRIYSIQKTIIKAGCLERMIYIKAREVTAEEACLVHTPEHWDFVNRTSGNGTQKAFYNDPNVVYCSIHRYENAHFYPGDKQASHTHVGGGNAKGKTINIPWPRPGMCDSDYIYAFNKVVMPIAFEFDPDIVIVSAGFDAAEGDPMGENHVSPVAYGHMTHMLKSLAGGKLVLALEGGYNLESISKSALACVKVLLGESPARLGPIKPSQDCIETIHQVIRVQSRYWSSLAPEYVDASEDKTPGKFVVSMIGNQSL
ncbi:1569_t:CDS:2 [Acaulospora colombiana]|uniref:1569_t:CDS:1 n=1 Tax=Acaulospora colombiana TaxID=27376 RepID=A0ACA9LAQ6_9GLOM|nr:1569_t:CDS:2 [Acaulospora colombiana]